MIVGPWGLDGDRGESDRTRMDLGRNVGPIHSAKSSHVGVVLRTPGQSEIWRNAWLGLDVRGKFCIFRCDGRIGCYEH